MITHRYHSCKHKVFKLAEQFNWTVAASHIPGISIIIPDNLSRLSRCGDYAIKREVLQKTLKELGTQISIDIFATRANRQCTRYCNIFKDKCAIKRNEFKLEQSKEVPLLHPSISQLLKTIRKFKKDRVQLAVLVAPDLPNQKWFTELGEIAMQKQCLVKSTKFLLIGAKHRNKGWALPHGLIYLFLVGTKKEKSFSYNCYKLED
ncbi:MAG: hypothetical protein EZS28_018206 [Streblomastix strix]|uniref:Uncharacterized protein n=1 Tax=Streblomastix strix TaxID=222440 RepID=A0A5J4VVJ3_9EUKA|nr:MAG: hypothetical protein EZS28_018206 [Streblomastix strix]